MDVRRRTAEDELQGDDAAKAVGECRRVRVVHRAVGDDDGVGLDVGLGLGDVAGQCVAAGLFLALQQEQDFAGQFALGLEQALDGLDVGPELAFVVGRPPAVQDAVADGRLERRGLPLVHRVLRLHVVVPIDHHAFGALALLQSPHDGLAADIDKSGLESQTLELRHDPFGAGPRVLIVGPLGADRREPHELLEFLDETNLIRVDIRFNSIRHVPASSQKPGHASRRVNPIRSYSRPILHAIPAGVHKANQYTPSAASAKAAIRHLGWGIGLFSSIMSTLWQASDCR